MNAIRRDADRGDAQKLLYVLRGQLRRWTIGLSVEDTTGILQTMEQLRKEDREELERRFKEINGAKTEEEKKSLARRTCEFIRERGWGIFDSLVASGIVVLSKGSQ